jgi:ubiquinone/menaquinone biosynthesis C-methylase UbiE
MHNKRAEKDFFNKFVQQKEYDVFDERGYRRILSEFNSLVSAGGGRVLLDVGCGTGAFTKRLKNNNDLTLGVDISFKSVFFAKSVADGCYFFSGDAEDLPFRDESIDIVVFSGVIHHLPTMDNALAECFRIMKSGGEFFAYDPNGMNPAMWLYRSPKSPLSTRKGWTENERLLRRQEISSALKKAGFSNMISKGISGVTYKYVGTKIGMKILTLYNLFDLSLGHFGLSDRFGSFLVSYGRKS